LNLRLIIILGLERIILDSHSTPEHLASSPPPTKDRRCEKLEFGKEYREQQKVVINQMGK